MALGSATTTKTPAKSRGNWLWRIYWFTAVVVEPIVVADSLGSIAVAAWL